MSIFGSYIGRDRTLLGETLHVCLLDTLVAISAGVIIIPACFAYGVHPGQGPGLIFTTLPNVFNDMPLGRLWGSLFFVFMSCAALMTVIAVFENILACLMDAFGWSRRRAGLVTGGALVFLALPCLLGFNVWGVFQPFGAGSCVLDLEDFFVSNLILPLGGLAHQPFSHLGERDDRGRRALPLGVGDDDGLAALDHRHTAVGSPQVNSDYFCHGGACPFKKDTFES